VPTAAAAGGDFLNIRRDELAALVNRLDELTRWKAKKTADDEIWQRKVQVSHFFFFCGPPQFQRNG
jgi:hypothetical protein